MTETKGKKPLDANEREQIIFKQDYDPRPYAAHGGIKRFECISYATVKKLIDKGYLDPEDFQNASPTAEAFVKFVEKHNPDNWYFHGYVVESEPPDTRVTIEGVGSHEPLSSDDLIDYLQEFRYADELDAEKGRTVDCWYD